MARQKTPTPEQQPAAAAEAYTVLARRYRPQTFADLVGQEPVARALANALKGNRVAHAYLFTGARGVGKTSTARILAKALNCVEGPTATPCGECDICQSIATGEDVDVLEIDGASNNGVENIRDLRSNVQYLPQRARFKIYIIDEIHMLSKGAFNALLKTLEEPPAHVKFIFATTEVEKVPITVLSRCQRFDFAGIPLPRIVERLQSIVEQENVRADPEALQLIARRAGGSMRDAQSLLDQLLAFGGDKLSADQVHHLLGTAGDERILALAESILGNDPKKALDQLDEAVAGGLQLGELVEQLLAYWRDLMVVQCGGTEGRDFSVPARHHDTLRQHSKQANLDAILAGLDVLSSAKARLRGSAHGRTIIEMAVVRLCRLHDLVALSQLATWVNQVRSDPRTLAAAASARPALPEVVKKKPLMAEAANGLPSPGPVPFEGPPLTEATWPHYWPQIAANVGPMLGSELRKAGTPAISGPNSLVFRFPAGYNQAMEYCSTPEQRARVEEAIRRVTGNPWTVLVETDASRMGPVAQAEPVNVPPLRAKREAKEEAEKVPLVKRTVEVLGATIQRVDEDFGEPAPAPARQLEEEEEI
jgi:DNA polymerase-3 subunit gamma/tau